MPPETLPPETLPPETVTPVTALVDPFAYAPPGDESETIAFANANGYLWAYRDTCGENAAEVGRLGGIASEVHARRVRAKPVPDGWPYAYLEHIRRHQADRMTVQDAFRTWRDTGTLPGLT